MSGLRERLDALRRQGGARGPGRAREAPAEAADVQTLRARIERMRVGVPAARRAGAAAPPGDADSLARKLGAQVLAPGLLCVEHVVPPGAAHGAVRLAAAPVGPALADLGIGGTGAPVLVDTETTGLAGGTGTVVFLIGLARLDGAGLRVRQYLLSRFDGEAALIAHAGAWMPPDAVLVSFNGKTFDLPLLATRARLARVTDPFSDCPHLDLLHVTRRAFAERWPDCRLATAEARLLGLEREDDLSGAEAPAAWLDWIRRGAEARLGAVLRHNRLDLLSLAALAPALARCTRDPLAFGANVDRVLRTGAGEDEDFTFRYLCANRERIDAPALLTLARLARRRGDWTLAEAVWEGLAAHGHRAGLEAMAKLHEHRLRDPERALAFTRALLAVEPANAEHRRRERRLLARLGHGAAPAGGRARDSDGMTR